MYSLTVRDKLFIAHSLKLDSFGPARNLHGATLVAEAEFQSPRLDADNLVIDIGIAAKVFRDALSVLDYKNLDELPELQGEVTTVEFLARYVHDRACRVLAPVFAGRLKITLRESPDAWASYEAEVAANGPGPAGR